MSFTLPTADYIRMRGALQEIACGRKLSSSGHSQRMAREELRDIARAACEHFGWPYAPADIAKLFSKADAA